eukprot:5481083-Amphidinium_carterae.1
MERTEEEVLAAAAVAVPIGEALVEELLGETPSAVEGVAAEGGTGCRCSKQLKGQCPNPTKPCFR